MLLFDFSDKSLKVLKLSPRLLGGDEISGFATSELSSGLIENSEIRDPDALTKEVQEVFKKAVPKPLIDKDAAFVLHDERSFNLRLASPITTDGKVSPDLLEKQLAPVLPVSISTVVYNAWEQNFAAIDKEIFSTYISLFEKLGLRPQLAVPESQSVWAFLLSQIGEGETIAFLDIGAEATDVILLDRAGVLQSFTAPIETASLASGVADLLTFSQEKFGRKPGKIFLGGGGALSLDAKKLSDEMEIPVVSGAEVLKAYPVPISVEFGRTSKLGFITLFGLALLVQQKSRLNFVR